MENQLQILNGSVTPTDSIQRIEWGELRFTLESIQAKHGRVAAFFGSGDHVFLIADLADAGRLEAYVLPQIAEYQSQTPGFPAMHLFERELFEQFNITPHGHPWLKPVRFDNGISGPHAKIPCGETSYFQVSGEEVHEVAVGPVHAGVIEPGHFRFQCFGEWVQHLEISLGYQHRGIEKSLVGGPNRRSVFQIETVAGDTTIGHTMAYAHCLEALGKVEVSPREHAIRAIALELERLANHTGDLGALAQDVGYLPTSAYCGRIRGDFLNMTASICGSRLGRGLVIPGGVRFDIEDARRNDLLQRIKQLRSDFLSACDLLWARSTVLSRFEKTGVVTLAEASDIGLVGVAARASGIKNDARTNSPLGYYREAKPAMRTSDYGDVLGRARVRYEEALESMNFIENALVNLPEGRLAKPKAVELCGSALAVSIIEGWRGPVVHAVVTDEVGRIRRYKIVDPSFHNWTGLALALRGEEISDFPLCNKSFNLSYCGYDL